MEPAAKRRKISDDKDEHSINTAYWYQDNDINTYLNLVIDKEIGGYAKQGNKTCSYLLRAINGEQFIDDNNAYFVLVTPAIDTASQAAPIDFYFDKTKQQAPDAGREDMRRDVFDELLPLLAQHNECHIKILFPYNITQNHWLTGEIQIHRQRNICQVHVYAHDPYGGGKIYDANYQIIKDIIDRQLKSISVIQTVNIENNSSPYLRRQAAGDAVSCGVIAADDIVKRITGATLNLSNHEVYADGASELREKQLKTIKLYLKEDNASRRNFISRTTRKANQSPAENNKISTKQIDLIQLQLLLQQIKTIQHADLRERIIGAFTNKEAYSIRSEDGGLSYAIGISSALIQSPTLYVSEGGQLNENDVGIINNLNRHLLDKNGTLVIQLSLIYEKSCLLIKSTSVEQLTLQQKLPPINIDFQEFELILKEHLTPSAQTSKEAKLLSEILKYLDDTYGLKNDTRFINEKLAGSNLDKTLQERIISRINSVTSCIQRFIHKLTTVTLSDIPRKDVRILLLDVLDKYRGTLEQLTAEPFHIITPHLHTDRDAIKGEQANLFNTTLRKIKKHFKQAKYDPRICFISYAWPIQHTVQDNAQTQIKQLEDESWVQGFLKQLRADLKEAGITAILDIVDNTYGNNIYQFMEQAQTSDYVLLMGTQSLLTKHKEGLSLVCTELNKIKEKRRRDAKLGLSPRVFPISLSGSSNITFPAEYNGYSTIRPWQNKHYLTNVKELIRDFYGISSEHKEYKQLWDEFEKKYPHVLTTNIPKTSNLASHDVDIISSSGNSPGFFQPASETVQSRVVTPHMTSSLSNYNLGNNYLDDFPTHPSTVNFVGRDRYLEEIKAKFIKWQLMEPVSDFYGRKSILKDLSISFETNSCQIITQQIVGLGGVGKTQLALQFAKIALSEKRYKAVIWLNADRNLNTEWQNLATEMSLNYRDVPLLPKIEMIIKEVHIRLQKFDLFPYLLVYDNVTNMDDIRPFFPQSFSPPLNNIHLLITTRDSTIKLRSGNVLRLGPFSEAEGAEYICNTLENSTNSKKHANELTRILEGLPLALTQAMATIRSGAGFTLQKYLEYFNRNKIFLLDESPYTDDPHQQSVYNTLSSCIELLEKNEPNALHILDALAFLQPAKVSIEIVKDYLYKKNKNANYYNCIRELLRYTLITMDQECNFISIHRLTQLIYKENLIRNPYPSIVADLLEVLKAHYYRYPINSASWYNQLKDYSPHLLNLWDDLRIKIQIYDDKIEFGRGKLEIDLETGLVYELLNILGPTDLRIEGNTRAAINAYEQSLKIVESNFGKSSWQAALALNDLSIAYGDLGNLKQQKLLLKQAYETLVSILGEDDWRTAIIMENLSNVHGALGNTSKHKLLLEKALEVNQKYYGKDDWRLASTLHNLGVAYSELGGAENFEKSKYYLEFALSLNENHYGRNHWRTALDIHSLGNIYGILRDLNQQKNLLEEALAINKNHFSTNHWYTSFNLHELANVHGKLGNTTEQKTLLEQAYEIIFGYFGLDHWCTAICNYSLGILYGKIGNTDQQKILFMKALPIIEKQFGKNHWRTAIINYQLHLFYQKLDDSNQYNYKESISILENHFGKDYIHQTYITLEFLALPLINNFPFELLKNENNTTTSVNIPVVNKF